MIAIRATTPISSRSVPGPGKIVDVNWSSAPPFKVPVPRNEKQRLASLKSYHILDTPPEEDFDTITTLAAQICQVPIALITLLDAKRQWFKSKVGTSMTQTPRAVALCTHTILQRHLLVVPDTRADKRFARNPLVLGPPRIRFYAGTPLVTKDNFALGTLCVLDHVPRDLTPDQRGALKRLGDQVMSQLELRKRLGQARQELLDLRMQNGTMKKQRERLEGNLVASGRLLRQLSRGLRRVTGPLDAMARRLSGRVGEAQRSALVRRLRKIAEELETLERSIPTLGR